MKLIRCVKIKNKCQRPRKPGPFCYPFSFFNQLPSPFHFVSSSRHSYPHLPVYSFFFSFCLSSLLISLLAMDAYFVRTPCWFMPGSSSRKLTAEEQTWSVSAAQKSHKLSLLSCLQPREIKSRCNVKPQVLHASCKSAQDYTKQILLDCQDQQMYCNQTCTYFTSALIQKTVLKRQIIFKPKTIK